jgi:hypothetical protein
VRLLHGLKPIHLAGSNKLITSIRDAESIHILCPGEARDELKAHLERNDRGERMVGTETVEKMTDRQISAKVRKYCADQPSGKALNIKHFDRKTNWN